MAKYAYHQLDANHKAIRAGRHVCEQCGVEYQAISANTAMVVGET